MIDGCCRFSTNSVHSPFPQLLELARDLAGAAMLRHSTADQFKAPSSVIALRLLNVDWKAADTGRRAERMKKTPSQSSVVRAPQASGFQLRAARERQQCSDVT